MLWGAGTQPEVQVLKTSQRDPAAPGGCGTAGTQKRKQPDAGWREAAAQLGRVPEPANEVVKALSKSKKARHKHKK